MIFFFVNGQETSEKWHFRFLQQFKDKLIRLIRNLMCCYCHHVTL